MSLSNKYPAEIITVTFDFSDLATALADPVITCTAVQGVADPDAATMLSGDPVIDGLTVLQRVINGVAGTTYKLVCQVDDADGERWLISDTLNVIAP